MKSKKRFQIIVSASNTITKQASSLRGLLTCLKKCQGTVSVWDNEKNMETYLGTVAQVVEMIHFEMRRFT